MEVSHPCDYVTAEQTQPIGPILLEAGIELLLEICRTLLAFGSGKQISGRGNSSGTLPPPMCCAVLKTAIKVVSQHSIGSKLGILGSPPAHDWR